HLLQKGVGAKTGRGLLEGADMVGRQVIVAEGQRYGESGSLTDPARYPDISALKSHQFLDQCEPDAGPLPGPPPGTFDPLEALEDVFQFRLRYAAPRVLDGQFRLAVCVANSDCDATRQGE